MKTGRPDRKPLPKPDTSLESRVGDLLFTLRRKQPFDEDIDEGGGEEEHLQHLAYRAEEQADKASHELDAIAGQAEKCDAAVDDEPSFLTLDLEDVDAVAKYHHHARQLEHTAQREGIGG